MSGTVIETREAWLVFVQAVSAPLTTAAFLWHSDFDVFASIKQPSEESFCLIQTKGAPRAPCKGCEAAIIPSSPK